MNKAQICMICTILATFLISGGLATAAADGPVSPLYLTGFNSRAVLPGCSGNGNANELHVIQGANEVRSWCLQAGGNETPLAVGATIRTIGVSNFVAGGNPKGGEYTLGGAYTGNSFVNPLVGFAENLVDGTRDATHNYTISGGGSSGTAGEGHVYSFDLKWQNPRLLFKIAGGNFDAWEGIAYDATNNSLWVASSGNSTIQNYTLDGVLLSSFTALIRPHALALDPADQTLWVVVGLNPLDITHSAVLRQYSKTGVLLTTKTYPLLATFNP